MSGSLSGLRGSSVNIDNRLLLFSANNLNNGVEPWISDGTVTGTRMLSDLMPGHMSSNPGRFVATGSRFVYFYANHPTLGRELWRTDGTAAGTQLVQDFVPGAGSSRGGLLVLTAGRLVLGLESGNIGSELFGIDLVANGQASAQLRGIPCGAQTGATLRASDPVLGGTLRITGSNAPAGTSGVLSMSLAQAPIPISGCDFYLDVNSLFVIGTGVQSAGNWRLNFPVPNLASLLRVPVVFQCGFGPTVGALGMDLTNGAFVVVGR